MNCNKSKTTLFKTHLLSLTQVVSVDKYVKVAVVVVVQVDIVDKQRVTKSQDTHLLNK